MFTVTLKLYPAIVTLHLLGGLLLLALLVPQHEACARGRWTGRRPHAGCCGRCARLLVLQIALGAWVSSNYAVLACSGFPPCNGAWWPDMDFGHGFTLVRELGRAGDGDFLPFEALVAIHMAHRLFAVLAGLALLALAHVLWHRLAQRGAALALLALTLLQVASGLSNVVLGWPLVAALAHTAGAAALVGVARARCWRARRCARAPPRIAASMSQTLANPASRSHALGPVLRADQAARGAAHRLLRPHRHAAGRARLARLAPGGCGHAGHLAGGQRGGGLQLPGRAAHRRQDGAHRLARHGQGRADERADAALLRPCCAPRAARAVPVGQPADDVADLRHLRRLCGDLHRGAQAADAAEHRHRRRLGRDAAGAGLGRDARRGRPRGADAVS